MACTTTLLIRGFRDLPRLNRSKQHPTATYIVTVVVTLRVTLLVSLIASRTATLAVPPVVAVVTMPPSRIPQNTRDKNSYKPRLSFFLYAAFFKPASFFIFQFSIISCGMAFRAQWCSPGFGSCFLPFVGLQRQLKQVCRPQAGWIGYSACTLLQPACCDFARANT